MSKVYIACGHGVSDNGSWDPGCVYGSHTEADLMLPITRAFVRFARYNGITVYTDSTTDRHQNMNACIREANRIGVDAYISLHCDYSGAPTGTYPYYYTGSKEGKKLASSLNQSVMKMMNLKTRGLHASKTLGELTNTNTTACIFETGSIKSDLKLFQNNPKRYGLALARGLCDYFGMDFSFLIKPKMNLLIRKSASLKSKKEGSLDKNGVYQITELSADGTRGKTSSGWITITPKYVDLVSTDSAFTIKTKMKLLVRESASLKSKKEGSLDGQHKITQISRDGTRGKTTSGWITITPKYVTFI